MASVSLYVDVDLDEVDTDDLVDEVCSRLKRASSYKSLSDYKKEQLKKAIVDLSNSLSLSPSSHIQVKTLDDKIKYEHFASIFNKYTSAQIESLLP